MVLKWFYSGVILELYIVVGGLCGASGLALSRRRRGRGQARGGGCAVGWEGWSFGLDGSLRWISAVEEVGKPKAQPVSVGVWWNWLEFWA